MSKMSKSVTTILLLAIIIESLTCLSLLPISTRPGGNGKGLSLDRLSRRVSVIQNATIDFASFETMQQQDEEEKEEDKDNKTKHHRRSWTTVWDLQPAHVRFMLLNQTSVTTDSLHNVTKPEDIKWKSISATVQELLNEQWKDLSFLELSFEEWGWTDSSVSVSNSTLALLMPPETEDALNLARVVLNELHYDQIVNKTLLREQIKQRKEQKNNKTSKESLLKTRLSSKKDEEEISSSEEDKKDEDIEEMELPGLDAFIGEPIRMVPVEFNPSDEDNQSDELVEVEEEEEEEEKEKEEEEEKVEVKLRSLRNGSMSDEKEEESRKVFLAAVRRARSFLREIKKKRNITTN